MTLCTIFISQVEVDICPCIIHIQFRTVNRYSWMQDLHLLQGDKILKLDNSCVIKPTSLQVPSL